MKSCKQVKKCTVWVHHFCFILIFTWNLALNQFHSLHQLVDKWYRALKHYTTSKPGSESFSSSLDQLPDSDKWYDSLFLICKDLGEGLMIHSHLWLFFFFFFLKWRSACTHPLNFSGQDQSSVAQQPEIIVAKCPWQIACELVSLTCSHTIPGQHIQPTLTSLGQQNDIEFLQYYTSELAL